MFESCIAHCQVGSLPFSFIGVGIGIGVVPREANMNDDTAIGASGNVSQPRVVVGLHGIWTVAEWHRPFQEVVAADGWKCRTNRWYFGKFIPLRFFLPWQREAKVRWFRNQYTAEGKDRTSGLNFAAHEYPSIVAHSFGTYILGHAMLKYDWIRFNKVILCGSILPKDFPWDELLDRGQVQAVRNEHGTNDRWAKIVDSLVAGTGPSGVSGFLCGHCKLEQEQFSYDHSEYFEEGHMQAKWVPFLNKPLPFQPATGTAVQVPKWRTPKLFWLVWLILLAVIGVPTAFTAYKFLQPDPDNYLAFCEYLKNAEGTPVRAKFRTLPPQRTFEQMCRDFQYIGVVGLDFTSLPENKLIDGHIKAIAEHIPSVDYLVLGDNTMITDGTPLGASTQLQVLEIRVAKESDISFLANLSKLRHLWLSNATIKKGDLDGLSKLETLKLTASAIAEATLGWASNLKELTISDTSLEEFDLAGKSPTETIVLANTGLRTLEIRGFQKLRTLTVNRNADLTAISIVDCNALDSVHIGRNKSLTDIRIENCGEPTQVLLGEHEALEVISIIETFPAEQLVIRMPPKLKVLIVSHQRALDWLDPEDKEWLSTRNEIVQVRDAPKTPAAAENGD